MSSYIKAKEAIRKGERHHLYVIYGTEAFIIDDLIQSIANQTLLPEEVDFNLSSYDMRETPVQVGLEDAETPSFFGSEKLIVLKHAHFLTAQKQKEAVDHDLTQFERFLDHDASHDTMILTVHVEKLDERKKVVKKLKKKAKVIEATPLQGDHHKQWLNEQVNQAGVSFASGALEFFIETATPDLQVQHNEIEKCALYAGVGGTITKEIIASLVSKSLEDNIFTLIDAVSDGNTKQALTIYNDLIHQGEEPIKITVLLARQLRIMSLIIDMEQRGYSQQKMASIAGVPPFVVGKIRRKAKGIDSMNLYRALSKLAEVDYKMKQGLMEKDTAMSMFIASLPSLLKRA